MSEYTDLLYELQGRVAVITLNRPERLNALSLGMREGLPRALRTASEDDEVRVVVITGAGRGFCSGADLTDPRGLAGGPEPPAGQEPSIADRLYNLRSIQTVVRAVQQLDKPFLAAVNGPAAGAGMDLASMADIRFAS